jgi:cyclophilin family peptidyl-prolyl cis-trans isomerase
VSKAAKRERQRQNREARREYEEALEKRRRFWRSARLFGIILIPIVLLFAFLALRNNGDDESSKNGASTASGRPAQTIDPSKTYVATVDTSEGSFQMTLDPKVAPKTVNSFVYLANQGFYDGLSFHRIAKDFVIQGGDPKGDGTGGPGYTLPDEPPKNGYEKYSVAMANSGPGTSGSQFFIVTSDAGAKNLGGPPYLYSALGKVTSGTETIDKVNELGSTASDPAQQTPTKPVAITKVTITES